jgi:cohesin complex subunit SA-1/2
LTDCVKDTETDLQTTAQEWVEEYQENDGKALAELINFVFRSSGCNATIDDVQVLDHDSIADTLDAIQESLKKESMPSYPLISRAANFRRFRRRLSDFMEKLFVSVDEADVVYDETMMETVTAWISAMSSSAFRSLRHTSTFVALLMVEQVNRMTRDNRAEINAAVKSREAERIKGVKANKIQVKVLDAKVKEANQVKKQLDGFQQELMDTVFIHRYRDSDASIRADCIGELGRWMKIYSDQYLSTSYFRYFGWVLSDQSEVVRLVAIKSLSGLYSKHEYEGPIQQFTQRFLPRITEMAVGDIDTSVRIAAISTLTSIDQQEPLEDEQSDTISSHIFDVEARIRAAVAHFIKQRFDEDLVEAEADGEETEVHKLRWKLLAQTLIKLSAKLDEDSSVDKSSADTVETFGEGTASRTSLAVGAICDVDDKLQDWSALIELLLYDHSNTSGGTPKGRKRGAASRKDAEAPPNEDYRLEGDEETVLLESVGVLLDRLQGQHLTSAKAQEGSKEGEGYSAMTRHLIPVMSRLFKKYKTELNRIVEVLGIARRLQMDTFVEYQQVGAFESLWDDVVDQYVRHVEDGILGNAVLVMVALNGLTAMGNINKSKITYLKETVIQGLLESTEDINLETDDLEEEQLHKLTSSASRIKHLIRSMDLAPEMQAVEQGEEEEASPAASAFDVLLACAKRGNKGAVEEEKLVSSSIVVLILYIMWSTRSLREMPSGEERDTATAALVERRAKVLEMSNNLLEGESGEILQNVKSDAFRQVLDLHIFFASVYASGVGNAEEGEEEASLLLPLRLKCDTTTQARLASFVESQLASYTRESSSMEESSQEVDEDEDGDGTLVVKGKAATADESTRPSLKTLQRQMDFVSGISHFIGAIRLGIIQVQYSTSLLSKFGRLGHIYDACLRVLVETIREVGISEAKPERACNVVLDSLLQAHSLFSNDEDAIHEASLINLAKMLSSSLVVRGAQLAILKKVEGRAVVNMHNRGIKVIFEKLEKDPDADLETQQKTLSLFKAWSQLLVSLEPREAITVKKDMDRMMDEYNIQVPLTAKTWDALRQYEKRLVTIASKSDSVRKHVEANKTKAVISRPKPRPAALNVDKEQDEEDVDSRGDLSIDLEGDGVGDDTRQEHQMDITLEDDEEDDE